MYKDRRHILFVGRSFVGARGRRRPSSHEKAVGTRGITRLPRQNYRRPRFELVSGRVEERIRDSTERGFERADATPSGRERDRGRLASLLAIGGRAYRTHVQALGGEGWSRARVKRRAKSLRTSAR